MDSLTQNAIAAKKAGMSYGKWKALQKPVKIQKTIPEGWLICQWCGKPFKPKSKRKPKFCDCFCQRQAYNDKRSKNRGVNDG